MGRLGEVVTDVAWRLEGLKGFMGLYKFNIVTSGC